MSVRPHVVGAAGLPKMVAAAALLLPAAAYGQAVERNLPPATAPHAAPLAPSVPLRVGDDDRPIGAALRAIVLLGRAEPLREGALAGVVLSPDLAGAGKEAALARFIGRPLSRKLIGEIETAVILAYRRAGLPFVSVATPEQEVTGGVLQLRVVEFRLGRITLAGGRNPADIERRIRERPGERIDAPRLSQDLDWLGRYPFRQIQPVFSPGAAAGATDLRLDVVETRPWRVYGGYANSGTPASGRERFFLGALVAAPGIAPDLLGSYQFTAARDFFVRGGRLFGRAGHPLYVSHAARLSFTPGLRQSLALDAGFIETNQLVQDFAVRQRIYEVGLGYRVAMSNLSRLPGDLELGVEARRQERLVTFGGVGVLGAAAEVYQARLGWIWQSGGPAARAGVEATLRADPGGLGKASGRAALAAYSNGRIEDARYAYGRFHVQGYVRIGGGVGWSADLSSQYASTPLPDTEQFGIGGQGLVRGYSLGDGAFDGGIILHNELGGPALPIAARARLSPYLFADAGFGGNRHGGSDASAASVGAGVRGQLGAALSAELAFACALVDAPATRAGNARLEIRITLAR